MSEKVRPPEPIPIAPRAPGRTTAVGALAVVGLIAGIGWSVRRGTPGAERARSGPRGEDLRSAQTERRAAEATAALASLTSALGSLSQAREKVTAGEPPPNPPPPEDFPSPTACARTFLPDVDVADSSLGFVCTETDAWTIERTLYVQLAHRKGGAHWTRLGRHTLAALAMLRSGCCPSPAPITAVVPGLWCGRLTDALVAIGPVPSDADLRGYDARMRCLEGRGVHLPDRFLGVPQEEADRVFSGFLRAAQHRSR